jgi:hypothetical protein
MLTILLISLLTATVGMSFFVAVRSDQEISRWRKHDEEQQSRIDRLMEAVASNANIPLILPRPPAATERSEGWWDKVRVTSGGDTK